MTNQDEFYSGLGNRIRQARLRKKLTQDQLAKLLSLNRTSITNIENGKQKILAHSLLDLAEILEISPSELLPNSHQTKRSLEIDELLSQSNSIKQREFLKLVLVNTRKGRRENAG